MLALSVASDSLPLASSLWSSVQSTTDRKLRKSQYRNQHYDSSINKDFFDYLEPDAQALSSDGNVTEFGRINFHFESNGTVMTNVQESVNSAKYVYQSVTDNEVFLRIRLIYGDALTVYAVRRFKIESFETDVTTRLTPMQPSSQRSRPVVDGFFANKPRPVDFTCTELDLSAMPIGTRRTPPPPPSRHCSHSPVGTRALLTAVSSGGSDATSSAMFYNYPDNLELHAVEPWRNQSMSIAQCSTLDNSCSNYYSRALYRQHTNSGAFHDSSPMRGRAHLVNETGVHVVCVSASDKDAGSVVQDGAMVLRFQKKDVKDSRSCKSSP